jgi:hypothetical protein
MTLRNPGRELLPCLLHHLRFGGEIGKPEPVNTGSLGVEDPGIQLGPMTGGGTVLR